MTGRSRGRRSSLPRGKRIYVGRFPRDTRQVQRDRPKGSPSRLHLLIVSLSWRTKRDRVDYRELPISRNRNARSAPSIPGGTVAHGYAEAEFSHRAIATLLLTADRIFSPFPTLFPPLKILSLSLSFFFHFHLSHLSFYFSFAVTSRGSPLRN